MRLYLYAWVDRFEVSKDRYSGGNWNCWCATAGNGEDGTYLGWIADALMKDGWVSRKEFTHIGESEPTTPPPGANVSRIVSFFDSTTPPDVAKV